jgi:hypothetical protein
MEPTSQSERFSVLTSTTSITASALRVFIDNVVEVALERGLKTISIFTPYEWRDHWFGRIGKEPLLRLLYVIMRDIQHHSELTLCELLAEDPALMARCMHTGNMAPYYDRPH